jgi:hypothetical protein
MRPSPTESAMASSEPLVEALGARGQGESECIFMGTMETVRLHCCSKDGIITSPPAARGDDTMTSLVQGTAHSLYKLQCTAHLSVEALRAWGRAAIAVGGVRARKGAEPRSWTTVHCAGLRGRGAARLTVDGAPVSFSSLACHCW